MNGTDGAEAPVTQQVDEVVTKDESARPEKDRAWLRLFAMALFVIGVTGAFAYIMRNEYLVSEAGALTAEFGDSFDRPARTDGLGETPDGQKWRPVVGRFGIDGGVALVTEAGGKTTIAVVGSLEYPSVTARVSGSGACGLVSRFVDNKNYVAARRAPVLGKWVLFAVRGGQETVLAELPDDGSAAFNVRLDSASRAVTMTVSGKSVTAIDPTEPSGTSVGLLAAENGVLTCAWDDVRVFAAT